MQRVLQLVLLVLIKRSMMQGIHTINPQKYNKKGEINK
jgi:hypothetical protein